MVRLPAIQLAAPLAMLGLLLSPHARAELKIKPGIEVRETYTDNVRLEESDNAHGQFISELVPSLSLAANGPRLKLYAGLFTHLYGYSGERYAGTSSSSVQFNSNGKLNVIEDLFYIDGSASRSRQSVSAFGPQFQSGYSNVNRDDITTYRISPYLIHRFGNLANATVRYTHDSVKSKDNLLANSTANALNINLASGPTFTSFGWDVQAYRQNLTDALAGESQMENIVGTLRYRLKQDFSVYANTGYDKYEYQGLGGTTSGKSYAGGFTWTPSLRTSIDASIGRRYYGKTYSLASTVRSRKTIWNINYRDEITTARAQFLQPGSIDTASLLDSSFASAFPDPIERRQAIDAYIRALGLPTSVPNNVNYFSNRLLLQKQLQASVVLNGTRSTAIASLSNTKRTALSTPDVDSNLTPTGFPNLNDDTRQTVGTLSLNYRLAARTAITGTVTRARSVALATDVQQQQTVLNLVLTHKFDRKLTGTVELRHNQGEVLTAGGRTYKENAVTASVSYQL